MEFVTAIDDDTDDDDIDDGVDTFRSEMKRFLVTPLEIELHLLKRPD